MSASDCAFVLNKFIYTLGGSPLPVRFPAAIMVGPLAVSVDGNEFLVAHNSKETQSLTPQLLSEECAGHIPEERLHYFLGKVALGRMTFGGISIDAMIDPKTDQRKVQVSLKDGRATAVLASHDEDGWLFNDAAITDGVIGVPAEGLQYLVREEYDASRLWVSGGAGEIRMRLKPGRNIRLVGLVSGEPSCRNGRLEVANFAGTIFLPRDANVEYRIRTTTGDVLGDVMHSGVIKSEIGNIAINCENGVSVGVRGESTVYGMRKRYAPKKTRPGFCWYRTVQNPVSTVLLHSETGHIIVGTVDSPIPQAIAVPTCGYKIVRRRYFG